MPIQTNLLIDTNRKFIYVEESARTMQEQAEDFEQGTLLTAADRVRRPLPLQALSHELADPTEPCRGQTRGDVCIYQSNRASTRSKEPAGSLKHPRNARVRVDNKVSRKSVQRNSSGKLSYASRQAQRGVFQIGHLKCICTFTGVK